MTILDKLRILKRHLFVRSEGELHLKRVYADTFGKAFQFHDCQTFTDKLFRRMILMHRRGKENYTQLADKIGVRPHIAQKIGQDYLVKVLWQGTNPLKIPFERLPQPCIIKVNNRCGGILRFNSMEDKPAIINRLKQLMSENFYWACREYQYYNIKPQIIVEEFLKDDATDYPLDYRMWCFNGQPEMIQVDNHDHNMNVFYDVFWQRMPVQYRPNSLVGELPKPQNFEEMLTIARTLSEGHDFIRVDLYNINGKIYFSELSFTPAAGHIKFQPEKWDMILGQKWIIPEDAIPAKPPILQPIPRPAKQGGLSPTFRSFF